MRENQNEQIVFSSYGKSSGFCIDPIEKKPLNHFYPGSAVLSFGTAGCNLACKFCQNWDISKSRSMDTLMRQASPEDIAQVASSQNCKSVAFTYNDPVIFHEYAIDTAIACKEKNILSVAVTAAYVTEKPREIFYRHIDAANVDLKAFSEKFYYKLTGSHLAPVLDSLIYIRHHTSVWLEITTLLIPGENDSEQEIEQLSQWVAENLGTNVPLHFTAFHPDWKLNNRQRTPAESLIRARTIAQKQGLNYVYTGNIHNKESASTYCNECGHILIGRDWYQLSDWNLNEKSACKYCGTPCPGYFTSQPEQWGPKENR